MGPLFDVGSWRCVELHRRDIGSLQHFYDTNPEYHLAVCGEPPPPDAAQEAFDARLPDGWPFDRKWILGFRTEDDATDAMADVIANLFVPGVWHVGLFIVATPLHGHGVADVLYEGLEGWMTERGAQWLRLGVVEGNTRAERFWQRHGYHDVRRREGLHMGQRVNNVRVMVKPLAEGALSDYLSMVARDRPESP